MINLRERVRRSAPLLPFDKYLRSSFKRLLNSGSASIIQKKNKILHSI
jgi:hypothetical protein